MKILPSLTLAMLVTSAVVSHAQTSKDAMSGMKMPAASQPSAVAWTDAVVQKIDTNKQMIVLKHGDIPNLAMPAMTMGFDVADKNLLSVAKAGEAFRFQIQLMNGTPTVTHLQVKR